MPREIFISYRRDDDPGMVLALYGHLAHAFSEERIFMDVEDGIPPGHDFVRVLEERVGQCRVLLAVIGRDWLTAEDSTGRLRLGNPEDFVRHRNRVGNDAWQARHSGADQQNRNAPRSGAA
jgi:hypothetical protein